MICHIDFKGGRINFQKRGKQTAKYQDTGQGSFKSDSNSSCSSFTAAGSRLWMGCFLQILSSSDTKKCKVLQNKKMYRFKGGKVHPLIDEVSLCMVSSSHLARGPTDIAIDFKRWGRGEKLIKFK